MKLTENLAKDTYTYFDNYFSYPELLAELHRLNIHATSTLRADRKRKCPLKCKRDVEKEGRGVYDYKLEQNDGIYLLGMHFITHCKIIKWPKF